MGLGWIVHFVPFERSISVRGTRALPYSPTAQAVVDEMTATPKRAPSWPEPPWFRLGWTVHAVAAKTALGNTNPAANAKPRRSNTPPPAHHAPAQSSTGILTSATAEVSHADAARLAVRHTTTAEP